MGPHSTFQLLQQEPGKDSPLSWDFPTELDDLVVLPSEPLAPLQVFLLSKGKLEEPLGVAALQTGPPVHPDVWAAQHCYWHLPATTLQALKRIHRLPVARGETLLATLCDLIHDALPDASEEQ
eukprot:6344496-Lingulodinium_polyedra.AAC.1